MSNTAKGIIAMVMCCTIWGLSPLYYAMLKHVPAVEVLAYRGLWSLVFFVLILLAQRRAPLVKTALRTSFWVIFAAAAMISVNWFGFIYAIQIGQGMEASLGYYIYPLVAVLLGWLMFNERLGMAQRGAIFLVAIAVGTLTIGLGVAPWIALALASTFAIYGVLKKRLDVGPVVSVTAEVVVIAPFAIGFIIWFAGPQDLQTHALLALSGPLTATPLILFSYAARRVQMSTIGVVQYLNPTLQFSCAVFAFSEPFTQWHGVAFPLIWTALIIYSVAALRQEKATRSLA